MESNAKTTLLGAALHYNDELREDVEEWVRNIVRMELASHMASAGDFERMHINNFNTFVRLVHEVQRHDLERLRNSGY